MSFNIMCRTQPLPVRAGFDCCGTKIHVFLPLRLASAVLELQLPNAVILKQLGITSN